TIEVTRGDWRPGDQKVFYADISKAKRELGWEPKINVEEGVTMLFEWVKANRNLF
ncbi:MAG: CDP-paratose 2-epimerase, partial [Chloroflexi bacterium CFX2]|nr:CDP-paratose 2-epimerase [Chloroflexi bacterium CFX2]